MEYGTRIVYDPNAEAARRRRQVQNQYPYEDQFRFQGELAKFQAQNAADARREGMDFAERSSREAANRQAKAAGLATYTTYLNQQGGSFDPAALKRFQEGAGYNDGATSAPSMPANSSNARIAAMRAQGLVQNASSGELMTPEARAQRQRDLNNSMRDTRPKVISGIPQMPAGNYGKDGETILARYGLGSLPANPSDDTPAQSQARREVSSSVRSGFDTAVATDFQKRANEQLGLAEGYGKMAQDQASAPPAGFGETTHQQIRNMANASRVRMAGRLGDMLQANPQQASLAVAANPALRDYAGPGSTANPQQENWSRGMDARLAALSKPAQNPMPQGYAAAGQVGGVVQSSGTLPPPQDASLAIRSRSGAQPQQFAPSVVVPPDSAIAPNDGTLPPPQDASRSSWSRLGAQPQDASRSSWSRLGAQPQQFAPSVVVPPDSAIAPNDGTISLEEAAKWRMEHPTPADLREQYLQLPTQRLAPQQPPEMDAARVRMSGGIPTPQPAANPQGAQPGGLTFRSANERDLDKAEMAMEVQQSQTAASPEERNYHMLRARWISSGRRDVEPQIPTAVSDSQRTGSEEFAANPGAMKSEIQRIAEQHVSSENTSTSEGTWANDIIQSPAVDGWINAKIRQLRKQGIPADQAANSVVDELYSTARDAIRAQQTDPDGTLHSKRGFQTFGTIWGALDTLKGQAKKKANEYYMKK